MSPYLPAKYQSRLMTQSIVCEYPTIRRIREVSRA